MVFEGFLPALIKPWVSRWGIKYSSLELQWLVSLGAGINNAGAVWAPNSVRNTLAATVRQDKFGENATTAWMQVTPWMECRIHRE